MFALGCIQSQSCHTNKCPVGVATQDKHRQRALLVEDKAERVTRFHQKTMEALIEIVAASGLEHPSQLTPEHFFIRRDAQHITSFRDTLTWLSPGELLDGARDHPRFAAYWDMARAETFAPS